MWVIRVYRFWNDRFDGKLSAMRKLFTVLNDSFLIASRNFTLVYIFLFSLFLLQSLMGLGGMPELTLKWALFGLTVFMLYAATMAGWFNMVGQACVQFLDRPRAEALSQNYVKESFRRVGDFLPGIGQFFTPVMVGYGIHLAYFVLFGWLTRDLWEQNLPILYRLAGTGVDQSVKIQLSLPPEQQASLAMLSLAMLAGLLIYAVLFLLLMLWPAFIVFYQKSGVDACFASLRQFFKDPLRLIALAVINLLIRLPFLFAGPVLGGGSPFLAILFMFMCLLTEVFFTVVLFVYAYQLIGKPIPLPAVADDGEAAQNPPQQ